MRTLALLVLAATALAQPSAESVVPSPDKPFAQPDQAERPLLHSVIRAHMAKAPGTFGAHPAAAHFPGSVASPERVSRARYEALRKRGHNHARALRSVADRLLAVACAMLTTRTAFDPDHLPKAAC